ncbi:MAG: hypothetical protein ACE5IA_01785 [Dehalococcoidia bacterium]
MELLPLAAEEAKLLSNAGLLPIVVTSESDIARGYFTEEMLGSIHDKLRADLARCGARVDEVYFCPHHPDEGCDCRRPKPRLVYQAARW